MNTQPTSADEQTLRQRALDSVRETDPTMSPEAQEVLAEALFSAWRWREQIPEQKPDIDGEMLAQTKKGELS